ncbi:hypothetical protein [Knoellia locipacati]|uniref:hypothetical protein n=1 Tax=Knoellia locipacati TaxID=882824 RepID=UPI0011BF8839|nr:hypothetical protein [Knoellia locipacati]
MDSIGMEQHHSHLQPDGTTFPPVTPDPPPPPGWVDPLADLDLTTDAAETKSDGDAGTNESED